MTFRKIRCRYPQRDGDRNFSLITHFWLESRAADAFEKARNAFDTKYNTQTNRAHFEEKQICLLVTDAGRDYEDQVALKKKKKDLAAAPGTSWHEAGIAMDFDMSHLNEWTGSQSASEAFLRPFGWIRTVPGERWHFEYHLDIPRTSSARITAINAARKWRKS
jgi:hypothetical protein